MDSTGQRIRTMREKRNWSQLELAKKAGINNSTLSKIETDKRLLESELLLTFADLFGVSTDELLGRNRTGTERPLAKDAQPLPSTTTLKEGSPAYQTASFAMEFIPIPVYGHIQTGADGIPMYEQYAGYEMIHKEAAASGSHFCYICRDDAMSGDGMKAGSRVLIRQQTDVPDGGIGLILKRSEAATLRRIHRQGGLVILTGSGQDVVPSAVPVKELNILGKAVRWTMED